MLVVVLLCVKHAQAIRCLRTVGVGLRCAYEQLLCISEHFLPAVYVAEIQQCDRVFRSEPQGLLEVAHRFIGFAAFRRDHAQIVPRLRMAGFQPHSFFEISSCLPELLSAQAQGAEVVVGLRVVRFSSDDLLKRISGRVEVPTLKKCDSVSEVVPLKIAEVKCAGEGQCARDPVGSSPGNHWNVTRNCPGIENTLINLHTCAGCVDEERCWKPQVAMSIKQVSEN